MTDITVPAMINNLYSLSLDMREVALQLEYHGGFNKKLLAKSKELSNAADMAAEWAMCMREEMLANAKDIDE